MLRTTFALALAVTAVGLFATHGLAAGTAGKLKICGQKHGPHAAWRIQIPGSKTFKFKGSTWTVFVSGTPCSFAMKVAPGLLKQWAKAKPSAARLVLPHWICTKNPSQAYSGSGKSSGSIGCAGPKGQIIGIVMYAPISLGQIKQIAGHGKLP
jgi:hypothetical protein